MKLNNKEFEKLLENEEDFDLALEKEQISQKITKLQAKEKHEDRRVYGNQDKKRFKR